MLNINIVLFENSNINGNVVETVLRNRGIENPKAYLNLNEDVVLQPHLLDNINYAVDMFMEHFNERNKIYIIVDTDVDGYCSAAIIYKYIKQIGGQDYPVEYLMHHIAKAHGITDDIDIPTDAKLLIVPDAGTNDKEQILQLLHNGLDIIILDHHELEETYSNDDLTYNNSKAIIVNNQMSSNYSNKEFCGAGIVYKFCKALDEYLWNEYADDYLDLVALANISDVMDMRSFETKYLVDCGLNNIHNKFFSALISAQNYSMKNKVNIHNISWFITPIINGMIRVGSYEEKELLFKAFLEQDEVFEYVKRATKDKPSETIMENIYDRAARLSKNAKSRQDKLKEKGVQSIVSILKCNKSDDKVIVVDTTEILDSSLTGLVAIKIAETFNKPCLLLHKHFNKKYNKEMFGGSARNMDFSPINSIKDIINKTNIFEARGHANACGIINLDINDVHNAISELNSLLKDVEYTDTYRVDFKLDIDDIDVTVISNLMRMEDIVGTGIEEPMIYVENIYMSKNDFEIIGKTEDTIKFIYNDIEYIMFKCSEGNSLYDFIQDAWNEEDNVVFSIVGKAQWNEYDGVKRPQIQIIDVEVNSTSLSSDDEDVW